MSGFDAAPDIEEAIDQPDGLGGCGIAAVATLSRVTFDGAAAWFRQEAVYSGFSSEKDLRKALKNAGLVLSKRKFHLKKKGQGNTSDKKLDRLKKLGTNAILSNHERNGPGDHWLVWDAKSETVVDSNKKRRKKHNTQEKQIRQLAYGLTIKRRID